MGFPNVVNLIFISIINLCSEKSRRCGHPLLETPGKSLLAALGDLNNPVLKIVSQSLDTGCSSVVS